MEDLRPGDMIVDINSIRLISRCNAACVTYFHVHRKHRHYKNMQVSKMRYSTQGSLISMIELFGMHVVRAEPRR